MTGTASTESAEFESIYKLKVTIVPTNKPMIRKVCLISNVMSLHLQIQTGSSSELLSIERSKMCACRPSSEIF